MAVTANWLLLVLYLSSAIVNCFSQLICMCEVMSSAARLETWFFQVNQELGEIGGVFVSKQPSDTDMGAKEPKTDGGEREREIVPRRMQKAKQLREYEGGKFVEFVCR